MPIRIGLGTFLAAVSDEHHQARRSAGRPEQKYFVNRRTGEIAIIYVGEDMRDALNALDRDSAALKAYHFVEIEESPQRWVEIPVFVGLESVEDFHARVQQFFTAHDLDAVLD